MFLLDSYNAALTAFHDSQLPFLDGLRPSDPEWPSARMAKDRAYGRLVIARREYRRHIEAHGCREPIGTAVHTEGDGRCVGILRLVMRA
jgi:hypothetical protein